MTVLSTIVDRKRKEVAEKKELFPAKLLEKSIHYTAPVVSLKNYLTSPDKSGIIAEFKRRSPSHPNINLYASVEEVSRGYMRAGASALSILTDQEGFGGSAEDLTTARMNNFCPILRKEFIVDEYQILESRSIGADAILLIAATLTREEISRFTTMAKSLDMEVLLELHHEDELSKYCDEIDLVGVNNRNLHSMEVDLDTSFEMIHKLPHYTTKISESGIRTVKEVNELKRAGYHGFLMGERFMKEANPVKACQLFIDQLSSSSPIVSSTSTAI